MRRAVAPTPFTYVSISTKNGCLQSVDESPTCSSLRRARVMPTFMRRMSDAECVPE
jgi:hypothetical protein